ncbi:MAG: hypothetical protein OXC42_00005 [Gammaproteobacteria bacterium]|nr:hypothetical protein [Gammaproteobacteria bacterium]
MGAVKRYPVSEWARLIYNEGQSVQQVAQQFGVSAKVVRARLYRAGNPKMRDWKRDKGPACRVFSNAQILDIHQQRELGMSWKIIGQKYNVDQQRICNIMRYQCLQRDWEWPIPVPGDY